MTFNEFIVQLHTHLLGRCWDSKHTDSIQCLAQGDNTFNAFKNVVTSTNALLTDNKY